ncbi:MAG: AAA-like domain-containing protein [Desulfobacterales bacterium]|nr:AAA-like domain-containing protein [Desulfobacterales bacterium]
MRQFHSYGPVNEKQHFVVKRDELIEHCLNNLVGDPEQGGHFFTIWAPRQTGKTWLMRQVKAQIQQHYGDKFIVGMMSMQGIVLDKDTYEDHFLSQVPRIFWESFRIEIPLPTSWNHWIDLFDKDKGIFKKPLILFIDEFDSLPPKIIDRLVTLFRDMYLKRESYLLHGLALIGVRAVLGVESDRGSPFNIQRSLHVPNFTKAEVIDLYQQYHHEIHQKIDPIVVESVYDATRGQPGLVCWFGELLTEKYNIHQDKPIDLQCWNEVFNAALCREWNNTILNLVKKAKGEYANYVIELFTQSNIPFSIWQEWCSYLYLNGIIDQQEIVDSNGKKNYVCRFASPFVQQCLYASLTNDLTGDRLPILALDPLDDLSDVFNAQELNMPALLERYKSYLKRLKAKGLNPWKEQPRRSDMHITEAVGHFHLYAWLHHAIGRRCVISPEFPTGNGKVDLHIRCIDKRGIIEVKSFTDLAQIQESIAQASVYAKQMGLTTVTIAMFTPVEDETVLAKLSREVISNTVRVIVVAIGWY